MQVRSALLAVVVQGKIFLLGISHALSMLPGLALLAHGHELPGVGFIFCS